MGLSNGAGSSLGCAFLVFFFKFALLFIIQNYLDSKEQIIKKYLLLFKIIDLDPLFASVIMKLFMDGGKYCSKNAELASHLCCNNSKNNLKNSAIK